MHCTVMKLTALVTAWVEKWHFLPIQNEFLTQKNKKVEGRNFESAVTVTKLA